MSAQATRPEDDTAPTTPLTVSAAGERCATCDAPLASDQRYCVNCGARRGRPRFTPEAVAAQALPEQALVTERVIARQPRVSPATTLVAGVATLLLAMGVGVLIGRDSANGTATRAAAPQVITVGGAPAAGASAGAAGTAAAPAKGAKHAKKTKVTVVHLTPKSVQAAAGAATKVLGSSAPKKPTVAVGQKCASDTAGCKNGKFSGSFFGP